MSGYSKKRSVVIFTFLSLFWDQLCDIIKKVELHRDEQTTGGVAQHFVPTMITAQSSSNWCFRHADSPVHISVDLGAERSPERTSGHWCRIWSCMLSEPPSLVPPLALPFPQCQGIYLTQCTQWHPSNTHTHAHTTQNYCIAHPHGVRTPSLADLIG